MLKKRRYELLIIIAVIIMIFTTNKFIAFAEKVPFETNAHAYVVMDANSGEILYAQNMYKKIYPASTAKLMTAIVAIEQGCQNKKFTVTKKVLSQVVSSATKLNINIGSKYSGNTLLHMMLIASDANASYILSSNASGSIKPFVKLMNRKTKELGLEHTSFDNPVGLDIGDDFNKTYSTAREMSIIMRYAMGNDLIRRITAKNVYYVPATNRTSGMKIDNTNYFYKNDYNKDLYTVIGGKTGTTNAAGCVLIAVAVDKDGHEVICAYFGKVSHQDTYEKIRKIFNYVFLQNKKGEINLSKGFLDMRFTEYEDIINNYLNMGFIKTTKSQKFSPDSLVTEKELIQTIRCITGISLKGKNRTRLTYKDFVDLFFMAYPLDKEANTVTGSAISGKSKDGLNYLYDIGIFNKNHPYVAEKKLTKLDMLQICHYLKIAVSREYLSSSFDFISVRSN